MSPGDKTKGKVLVVDASVALKWQLDDEECVPQAIALRDDNLRRTLEVHAPTLLLYEVLNGLVMATRRARLPAAEVAEAIQDLLAIGIARRTPDPQRVAALAQEHGITAYDSAYLALAEQEGCELWTGDLAFYRTVRSTLSWVHWIGDYPLPSEADNT